QFVRRGRPHGNAFEAFEDVERPIEPLTKFAIADNIDASLRLLAHDLSDTVGEASFERRLVIGLAILDRSPELDQPRRADQAADMSGKNATGVMQWYRESPLLFEVRHHVLCKQLHRSFGIRLADHAKIHLKGRRFKAAHIALRISLGV